MDLFEHAERYPNVPGYKAQRTAKKAAEEMKPRAPTIRAKIMESMDKGYAWTPDKFAAAHGLDKLAVRPRFSELGRLGKIVDTEQEAINDSGKPAIVWCAPQYLDHYQTAKGGRPQ